jgi:hypothetical protein
MGQDDWVIPWQEVAIAVVFLAALAMVCAGAVIP